MISVTLDSKQFDDVLKKQVKAMRRKGSAFMAERIVDQMERNVDRGIGFDEGKFEREYAQRTIRDRKRGGYQVSFADLQRGKRRVKTAFVDSSLPDRSVIRFMSGGAIMNEHNWGLNKLPRRQLFPDIQGGGQNSAGNGQLQQPNSIPRKIVKDTKTYVAQVMNKA